MPNSVVYTNGIYGCFEKTIVSTGKLLVDSSLIDLSEPEHSSILWRMKYVFRIRRLVKIVFDETHEQFLRDVDVRDTRPTVQMCLSSFQKLNKKYDSRTARIALAMATQKGLISIDRSRSKSTQQRLVVTGNGLVFLTPTGFANELATSISKVSTIGSWIVAIIALIVAIHKR